MTKFIFFLLNLQGYLSRLPYLLQIVEKSFLYKKVYIKIFIHFKLLYNNWKSLPCTQASQWRTWFKELKWKRICSYIYQILWITYVRSVAIMGTPPPIPMHVPVLYLFMFNLKLCIFYMLTITTKKSYWVEYGPLPLHLQYSFYMVLLPEQGCIVLMFQT